MSLRKVARQYHVSHTTAQRNGQFSRAIDTIAAAVGEQAKTAILKKEIIIGRLEVRMLAVIATDQPQTAKDVIALIKAGKKKEGEGKKKEANLIVRQAYEAITGERLSRTQYSTGRLYGMLSYLAGELPKRRKKMEAEEVLDWIEGWLRRITTTAGIGIVDDREN
jgi:hypothetical protein